LDVSLPEEEVLDEKQRKAYDALPE